MSIIDIFLVALMKTSLFQYLDKLLSLIDEWPLILIICSTYNKRGAT